MYPSMKRTASLLHLRQLDRYHLVDHKGKTGASHRQSFQSWVYKPMSQKKRGDHLLLLARSLWDIQTTPTQYVWPPERNSVDLKWSFPTLNKSASWISENDSTFRMQWAGGLSVISLTTPSSSIKSFLRLKGRSFSSISAPVRWTLKTQTIVVAQLQA